MGMTFIPLHPLIGAECAGLDIGRPLTANEAARIHEGMDRYAVLVFRRPAPLTPLTTAQQLAFTASLGEMEKQYRKVNSDEGTRLDDYRLSDISNLSRDNSILDRDDRKRLHSLGNRLWHSDSSYKHVPARYSALCAHVIPPQGGDTEFADMRAAWDALDADMRQRVTGLTVEHSRLFSKGTLGFQYTEEEVQVFAPVRQPLLRVNPRNGRVSLFLSSHGGQIVGWPLAEARMLLRDLTEHATQREFVYRHRWRVGDLVMWDNGATMHRGRYYDDLKYARDLRRTTLTNGVPAQAAAAEPQAVT
jgi:alpha-ketoglutarate-dependent 2,4-dichlorophenoxyacetate dioxygenase